MRAYERRERERERERERVSEFKCAFEVDGCLHEEVQCKKK